MGQCTSKNVGENGVYNHMRKSDRQLRTGVKFKDIEFGGFVGFSITVNDVYTPSGIPAENKNVETVETTNPVKPFRGVNPGGDGGDTSPPLFGLGGTPI